VENEELTFAIVFHGVEEERPLFASFPDELI
jgi:hypothetical protein